MNNAICNFREPKNESVLSYSPGNPEHNLLEEELKEQSSKVIDIHLIIGGKRSGQEKPAKWSNLQEQWLASSHVEEQGLR